MSRNEPQITEIASYLAATVPTPDSEPEQAVQAWRHTLRYARDTGAIEPLTEMLRGDAPDDARVARYIEELRS